MKESAEATWGQEYKDDDVSSFFRYYVLSLFHDLLKKCFTTLQKKKIR